MSSPAMTRATEPFAVLRFLDVIVVLAAAPFVLLAGAPFLGYAVAAVAWIAQRFIAIAIEAKAKQAEDVRRAVGLNVGALLARVWLLALAIVLVGVLADKDQGVAACVTALGALTIYFANGFLLRALEGDKR